MKKTLLTLAVIATMVFTAISASAAEVEEAEARPEKEFSIDVFEEKFDVRMATMNEKFNEKVAERTATLEERLAKSVERTALRMEVVEQYTPELVLEFEAVYNAHVIVHQTLFNEHMLNKSEFFAETNAGLTALKDEVITAVKAGTMSGQEARAELKSYTTGRREEHKATVEAYKTEIAPLNEINDANREIAKGLKAELKSALEVEDTETIVSVLYQLLDLTNTHVEYDYAKLAILETY